MLRSAFCGIALLAVLCPGAALAQEISFDDPGFRRCISWMMTGTGGALIDNPCLDNYGIPPPSLFMCASKVQTGFTSENDREVCAIIFEEQVKKVRAGYIIK